MEATGLILKKNGRRYRDHKNIIITRWMFSTANKALCYSSTNKIDCNGTKHQQFYLLSE
jgi:hypothetical protein